MRHSSRPNMVKTRKCEDCPQQITAYGGRKRCCECQEKKRTAPRPKRVADVLPN